MQALFRVNFFSSLPLGFSQRFIKQYKLALALFWWGGYLKAISLVQTPKG
jgi:hypothetical protein